MEQDPIIAEVRKNRESLLARFDNDLDKLYAHIKDREKKSKVKLKNFSRNKGSRSKE
jgi:hypothetical protein